MVGKRVIKRFKENTNMNVYTAGRDAENTDLYIDLEQIEPEVINPGIRIDVLIHCAASFSGDDIDGYIKSGIINSLSSIRIGEVIQLKCK